MEQRSVVIVAAKRTPIGRFMGAFADVPAVDLGIAAAGGARRRRARPGEVSETVAGHGRQADSGPNPARQVSVRAEVPETVPAYTVNKACGSSAKALTLAAGSVILGELDVALVVGMENMTRTPYLLRGMRGGYRMGPAVAEDAMSSDGFMDPLAEAMGEIGREPGRAPRRDPRGAGRLRPPVPAPGRRRLGGRRVRRGGRPGRHLRRQAAHGHRRARRAPSARDHPGGPGQARAGVPQPGHGHRRQLLGDLRRRRRPGRDGRGDGPRGIRPLARIAGWASAGVDPRFMGWGVVPATRKLLGRLGWDLPEVDVVEVNEAFAAQVLACDRELSSTGNGPTSTAAPSPSATRSA